MGYLDDEVKRLQSVVDKLEGRVRSLESRQLGGAPISSETIRMILIGPPGAGKTPSEMRATISQLPGS